MNVKNKISNYLNDATGLNLAIKFKAQNAALPIYLTKLYDYAPADIMGESIVFAILRQTNECPPIPSIKNHLKVIEKNFEALAVLVFENRAPRRLNLLVKNNLPYIYLEKEIYLPFIMLKLKSGEDSHNRIERTDLKGLSQAILTHQLIYQDLDNLSLSEISQVLSVPKASLSRALNQLEAHMLCAPSKIGKKKSYRFLNKSDLWRQSYNLLVNPVVKSIAVDQIPMHLNFIKSGITALSEKTLLDDSNEATVAIHSSLANKINLKSSADPIIKLEFWSWDPSLTAIGGIADPISTYFSLKNTDDERVAIARDEYLSSVGLEPIQSKESD
ncbi:MAG: hypothetical protein ACOH5I_01625 [Oligoflexus sp.]